jgi:hypothetical protein
MTVPLAACAPGNHIELGNVSVEDSYFNFQNVGGRISARISIYFNSLSIRDCFIEVVRPLNKIQMPNPRLTS